jgi:hypothetical protein
VLAWLVPVLTLTDRAEARRADRLAAPRPMSVVEALARHVGHDAALCSDGGDAYRVFARLRGLTHYRIDAKPARGSSTAPSTPRASTTCTGSCTASWRRSADPPPRTCRAT